VRHDHGLRLVDWFCGAGGSTQGAAAVPGVVPVHAANHWDRAIETHSANFPGVEHHKGDISKIDMSAMPSAELFWASPECTTWSRARGKTVDYASVDLALPGMEGPVPDNEVVRSRALMEEVPMYLRAMALRGKPVLAGVVENVVDIRDWTDWHRWRREIEAEGYRTRLIALNSMHAESRVVPRAPQSRDRLYLAYWHTSLGRDPDWDKWLRPKAWCPVCGRDVDAVQYFKRPDRDMGRYRSQYVYRCPNHHRGGRDQIVEPVFAPAWTVIDWSVPGTRIGDRARPLRPRTTARIEAGIRRFARPITVEAAGHTFDSTSPSHAAHGRPDGYVRAWPVDEPMRTLHTSPSKGVAVPPMLVPVAGRGGKSASSVHAPGRTQSTRPETGLAVPALLVPAGGTRNENAASVHSPLRTRTTRESEGLALVPPFVAELRGGGSVARPVREALSTVTASGTHHGLCLPPAHGGTWETWAGIYQYDTGGLRTVLDSLPTQTTVQGDALLEWAADLPSVEDVLFRMLEPHEIGAGMAFRPDYRVLGNRRERVRQFGNAVTPPAAEVIVSALVEAITGESLERAV
jgi:DNA (cytosine-5)-methyltransferase 1